MSSVVAATAGRFGGVEGLVNNSGGPALPLTVRHTAPEGGRKPAGTAGAFCGTVRRWTMRVATSENA